MARLTGLPVASCLGLPSQAASTAAAASRRLAREGVLGAPWAGSASSAGAVSSAPMSAVPRTSQARCGVVLVLCFGDLDHIMIVPGAGLERLLAHIALANFCQIRVSFGSWVP